MYPLRHIAWTDDFTVELPIRKTKDGVGSVEPTTLIDEFKNSVKQFGDRPALSVKRNERWVFIYECIDNINFCSIL
jgi:long-chain-fatty-acid--CoA ligase ACSBG